jgi:hypothetical protein
MCYPRWVDDALAAALLAEKDGRGKQVVMFAASIGRKGHELVGSQCVDAPENTPEKAPQNAPDKAPENAPENAPEVIVLDD